MWAVGVKAPNAKPPVETKPAQQTQAKAYATNN